MAKPQMRKWFLLADGLVGPDRVRAIAGILHILRPAIVEHWIDAYSDVPLPQNILERFAELRALAPRRGDQFMGIDLDPQDDYQFDLLVTLAPWVIHVEGITITADQTRQVQLFSLNDTGTAASFALTDAEYRQVVDKFRQLGVEPDMALVVAD